MNKFKIGDKVKLNFNVIMRDRPALIFLYGLIGEIVNIDDTDELPYEIFFKDEYYSSFHDEINILKLMKCPKYLHE